MIRMTDVNLVEAALLKLEAYTKHAPPFTQAEAYRTPGIGKKTLLKIKLIKPASMGLPDNWRSMSLKGKIMDSDHKRTPYSLIKAIEKRYGLNWEINTVSEFKEAYTDMVRHGSKYGKRHDVYKQNTLRQLMGMDPIKEVELAPPNRRRWPSTFKYNPYTGDRLT